MNRELRIASEKALIGLLLVCVTWFAGISAFAADWPQWRYDAGRTAASPEELAAELHLQWVRRLPPPQPAWPKYPRLCFDVSYEPVVMGKSMFVPSMVTDSVTAVDTDTGAERWKFYTDGPVRFAPVAHGGKVYFVSDDGHLYCLNAADGRLLWKFRGLPSDRKDRKVLGNDRLISLWPARGGPVLADGKIYFAAGIWPFDGVYIYALDAETGKPVWSNKDSGRIEHAQLDHGMKPESRPEGGLSPQGYFALIRDKLFVPNGRAMPGIMDRNSGKREPYCSSWGGRINLEKGSWYLSGIGKHFFQSGDVYDLASGIRLQIDPANRKELGEFREMVLTAKSVYYSRPVNKARGYRPAGVGYDRVVAWDITKAPELKDWKAEKGHEWMNGWSRNPIFRWRTYEWKVAAFRELWSLPSKLKVHIKSGPRLYCGGDGTVAAIDIPGRKRGQNSFSDETGPATSTKEQTKKSSDPFFGSPKVSWKADIRGTPSRMLAADGKLFVVTREGSIHAFGPKKAEPKTYVMADQKPAPVADNWTHVAKDILKATGAKKGYCLVLGAGSGRLAAELVRQSELHVIVVDPDAAKVRKLRGTFDKAGLYGRRIAVDQGDPLTYPFPPYIASLIVSEDSAAAGLDRGEKFVKQVFRSLRPYGGVACLPVAAEQQDALAGSVKAAGLGGAELKRAGQFALLSRVGALAGSADWTHENGDAGNSLVSRDKLVKPPFGILWFGGAVDMLFPEWDYTHFCAPTPLVAGGRMFFQVSPNLHAVDIYTGRHLWSSLLPGMSPDSTGRGRFKYVVAEDSVYLLSGKTCFRIDAANGSTLSEINSPVEGASWREVRILNNSLLGMAGKVLFCMDRKSGDVKWKYQARKGLVGLAAGGGRVFCADASLPDRRGKVTKPEGSLVALDASSGKQLWQVAMKLKRDKEKPLRSLWLGYSEANDILLTAYKTVSAYVGKDGSLLWDKAIKGSYFDWPYIARPGTGGPILHPDRLITQRGGKMYDPRTGSRLPGQLWGGVRGCGRGMAGQYVALIRDAHVSYFDFATCRQTYLRGVRSGCTNSLIAAGGLLNSPNYAHGCSCNYAIFASLALVPMTEVER